MVKEAAGYRHRQNNKLIAICIAPFGAFQAYNYFVNTVTTRSSHVTMQLRKHPFVDVLSHDTAGTITGREYFFFFHSRAVSRRIENFCRLLPAKKHLFAEQENAVHHAKGVLYLSSLSSSSG